MIFRRSLATLTSSFTPTVRQLLSSATPSSASPIQVNGWVKSVRKQKRIAFAVISDGSSSQGLQAVFTDVALAKRHVSLEVSGFLEMLTSSLLTMLNFIQFD
jgi:asparaginyl-tRNA synthetase